MKRRARANKKKKLKEEKYFMGRVLPNIHHVRWLSYHQFRYGNFYARALLHFRR